MNKILKSIIIGFEVPELNLEKIDFRSYELKLQDQCLSAFDIISSDLTLVELPNLNQLFYFNSVVLVDTTIGDINEELESAMKAVRQSLEQLLTDNSVIYKFIENDKL